MKGIGPIILLGLAALVVLYYMQSGSPDTSGLGDSAGDLVPTDPGGAAKKGADGVAEGAQKGADAAAEGLVPWIAAHPLVVGAGVLAAAAMAFYRKHKIMSIVILTMAVTALLVGLAT